MSQTESLDQDPVFQLKGSMLAITVLELMNQAKSVANSSYRYIEPMTLVGVFFLATSLVSVVMLRALEHRYGRLGK